MTGLQRRATRAAWCWCLLYTAPVPGEPGARRRSEMLSHLWEVEQAGVRAPRLLGATVRGAADDLGWSVRRGGRDVVARPGFWVALAAAGPVTALVLDTVAESAVGGRADFVAMVTSLLLLAVSGVAALRRRD